MRLVVTTPISLAIEADDVSYVRAEDETGAFGILPGHADFITTLVVSVLTWRNGEEREHHIAVRGGVLIVREGQYVEVVTHEAVGEDTLEALGEAVLKRMREETEQSESSRFASSCLEVAALRQLQNYLASGRGRMVRGAPLSRASANASEE